MKNDSKSKEQNQQENSGQRIAKIMARAGLCSRREAERWIQDGRVEVNGSIIDTPACVVTGSDSIIVDGKPLPGKEQTRLFLYHKPAGLVTTTSDEKGRPTVFDHLPADLPRLISVGRLDMNTEGLLLLTNDGELSRHLEHPKNAWKRTYKVRALGHVSQGKLNKLQEGITVAGVRYGAIQATLEKSGANNWITMVLTEGKNREIRKVLEHLGLQVNRLMRLSYGPFHLADLAKGSVQEIPSSVLKKKISKSFLKGFS